MLPVARADRGEALPKPLRKPSCPMKASRRDPSWSKSPERAALVAIYARADALLAGWVCACSGSAARSPEARCCHFAVTGREPYPTAIELEEVRHAVRAAGEAPRNARSLPMAELRPCPLLSGDGRCRIYASRPFGCRTFFCDDAEVSPSLDHAAAERQTCRRGARLPFPRIEVNALGRSIADLSARFAPRDPGPRPLVRALRTKG